MDKVGPVLDSAKAMAATAVDKVDAVVPDVVTDTIAGFYSTIFGDVSTGEFLKEWLPILYVTTMPVICLLLIICCSGGGTKKKMGQRILRRVGIAAQADMRMLAMSASSPTAKGKAPAKGKPYSSVPADVESGKSPIKNKAADVQQEKAIKAGGAKKAPPKK